LRKGYPIERCLSVSAGGTKNDRINIFEYAELIYDEGKGIELTGKFARRMPQGAQTGTKFGSSCWNYLEMLNVQKNWQTA
jgi:hypothetical protein